MSTERHSFAAFSTKLKFMSHLHKILTHFAFFELATDEISNSHQIRSLTKVSVINVKNCCFDLLRLLKINGDHTHCMGG